MTITATSILIAVTSAGAGGHGSGKGTLAGMVGGVREHGAAPQTTDGNRLPSAGDQAGTSAAGHSAKSTNDEVAYWHRLAVKRLRLLGARERRIVALLRRNHVLALAVHRGRNRRSGHLEHPGSVRGAICSVFGAHCSEALRVAWCESRWNVHATNGQYWGLFQFGSFARAHYGFAWNAWSQARAAYRYFLDAGWSPWTCRP